MEGVLAVSSLSIDEHAATVGQIKDLAPKIRSAVTDALADAFIHRNQSAVSVGMLIKGLQHVRLREDPIRHLDPWELPKGVKAVGSIGFPGYDSTGLRAFLQISHSWSIHGAVVTYVLFKQGGTWRIVARDQVVFV